MPFIIEWIDHCSGQEKITKFQTPAGQLVIHSQQDVIIKTDWASSDQSCEQHQFDAYWRDPGKPIRIRLLKQGSAYRNRVWAALCEIQFGATITYSALAKKIASSPRAVGNACRDNPYALFIPCHRVISVSGMGGYCGQTDGDLMAVKCKLLEFEAKHKK